MHRFLADEGSFSDERFRVTAQNVLHKREISVLKTKSINESNIRNLVSHISTKEDFQGNQLVLRGRSRQRESRQTRYLENVYTQFPSSIRVSVDLMFLSDIFLISVVQI